MTVTAPAGMPAAGTPRGAPLRHGLIAGLGVAQIVSWGTLVYSFPLLAEPTMRAFGLTKADVYLLASMALVVAALAAYPVGVAIDRGHGRAVMGAGSALAGLGFLAWSQVQAAWHLYPVFLLLGLVQAMTLYDAAFAAVARLSGAQIRRAVTTLTLWGGFASTVLVPLTQLLLDAFGWRGALVSLGLGNLAVAALVTAILAERPVGPPRGEPAPVPVPVPGRPLRAAAAKPAFWLLLVSFAVYTGIFSALSYHLYPLLMERGLGAAAVVGAIAVIGPAQVAGRIAISVLGGRLPIGRLGSVTVVGFPLAALLLLVSGSDLAMVYLFAALYGAANGIMTIVRGTAVPEMLTRDAYGAVNGAMGAPATAAKAAAPLAGALLWQASGSYDALVVCALAGASVAAACFWAAALTSRARIT
ncbi:MFS transporter [Arenibaculum sp.]|uniref:MFS transporter n=1 Tax=Arenibaculum sp. TaxID=2865862 RepID=UPI002E14BDFB|nr:MFS transporter [Arenibaculum sp.]